MGGSLLLGLGNSAMGQDQTIEARVVAKNADYSSQVWEVKKADSRITATATIKVTGVSGDQFHLLRSPAVLTEFSGQGLRLGKQISDGGGTDYVVTIEPDSKDANSKEASVETAKQYSATFRFEVTDCSQPVA